MPQLIITAANAKAQITERARRLDPTLPFADPGCLPRKTPYGHIPNVKPSTFYFPRIPRDRWPDLIDQGKNTWLSNLTRSRLPAKDQNGTNYCWAYGSVRSVEVLRVYQGQFPILLSAESVAVPITGGRNRGGYPEEALQQLRTYGACHQDLWPPHKLSDRHADPTWSDDRLNHVILAWADIENFDDQMTLALHRVPVPIGLGWWGHLVCQLDPIQLGRNEFGMLIDNSWGDDWGDHGLAILDEEHATADLGAFAPISETFSQS